MTVGRIPSSVPTGKEAALYSLYKFVKARFAEISPVPSPTRAIIDLAYEQTITYPNITIMDLGASQLKDYSFDRYLGGTLQGRIEQTYVEFDIQDVNTLTYSDAEKNVRNMRDQLKFCLQETAMVDKSGVILLNSIPLLDPNNADADTTSKVWHPRWEAGAWDESFLANFPEQPDLKKYRVTAKICWTWLEAAQT